MEERGKESPQRELCGKDFRDFHQRMSVRVFRYIQIQFPAPISRNLVEMIQKRSSLFYINLAFWIRVALLLLLTFLATSFVESATNDPSSGTSADPLFWIPDPPCDSSGTLSQARQVCQDGGGTLPSVHQGQYHFEMFIDMLERGASPQSACHNEWH